MRILHIGDIVGKPGRDIVTQAVPILREREGLDFVESPTDVVPSGSAASQNNLVSLDHIGHKLDWSKS